MEIYISLAFETAILHFMIPPWGPLINFYFFGFHTFNTFCRLLNCFLWCGGKFRLLSRGYIFKMISLSQSPGQSPHILMAPFRIFRYNFFCFVTTPWTNILAFKAHVLQKALSILQSPLISLRCEMFKQNIDVRQKRPNPFTLLHSPPIFDPFPPSCLFVLHIRRIPKQINWKITRLPV